jgi:hypothetical protein
MIQVKRQLAIRLLAAATVSAWTALCAVTSADAQPGNRFVLDDNQFNSWVFNNNGGSYDPDSELTLAIESIDRTCHLNSDQMQKLRLAGRGDYARFKQQLDEVRAQYVGKSYDQNDIGDVYQKIQPLTARYQTGLLGNSSLFSKVIHRALSPEQIEEYEAAQADRNKTRHAAKVRLFVALFERTCPLTATQRDALVDVLLANTRPPKRSSEYDWYVVLVQAAKIPDARLTAFLDDAQMKVFKQSMQQARGLEMHLKQQGVLPDP